MRDLQFAIAVGWCIGAIVPVGMLVGVAIAPSIQEFFDPRWGLVGVLFACAAYAAWRDWWDLWW